LSAFAQCFARTGNKKKVKRCLRAREAIEKGSQNNRGHQWPNARGGGGERVHVFFFSLSFFLLQRRARREVCCSRSLCKWFIRAAVTRGEIVWNGFGM